MHSVINHRGVVPDSVEKRAGNNAVKWSVAVMTMVFFLAGIGNIGLAVSKAAVQVMFLQSAVKTAGVVTFTGTRTIGQRDKFADQVKKHTDVNDSAIYLNKRYIHIALTLPDKKTEQFEYELGAFESVPEIGDMVTVYYDSTAPSNVRVGGIASLWSTTVVYLLFGVIFICAGIALISMLGRATVPRKINVRMQAQILSQLGKGKRLAAISLASSLSGMDIAEASVYVEELQRKYGSDDIWDRDTNDIVYRLPYKRPVMRSELRSNVM